MSDERPEGYTYDPQTGISLRFIRAWKRDTPAERAASWNGLRAHLASRERLLADIRYRERQTDAGRAVLRSLRISPG